MTEVGFLRFLLRNAFVAMPEDHGIRLCDGGGNESMLGLLVALRDAGLMLGAFCDNEGKSTGRWKSVSEALGPRCFQWHTGCLEANVIAHVEDASLFLLARDSEGASGERLRSLADRLGLQVKDEASILAACGASEQRFAKLRSLIVAAATGNKEGRRTSTRQRTGPNTADAGSNLKRAATSWVRKWWNWAFGQN